MVERLYPLSLAVQDFLSKPPVLVREVQTLGDKVLPGSAKLVFVHLDALNQRLADDFIGLIEERASAGLTSTF